MQAGVLGGGNAYADGDAVGNALSHRKPAAGVAGRIVHHSGTLVYRRRAQDDDRGAAVQRRAARIRHSVRDARRIGGAVAQEI